MAKNIPEYIAGIPTAKSAKSERIALINEYYSKLLRDLQKEHGNAKGNNYVVNDFLNANVYIDGNSQKKARNESGNKWQSTYAIKQLREVIKNAKPLPNKGLEVDVTHSNTQINNGYVHMIILYYRVANTRFYYLNFWVKLTIGVTVGGKHIQYAVNKIELA